jgi:AAHS family 4-hydroxybenzoate transporter-like MFS transporter
MPKEDDMTHAANFVVMAERLAEMHRQELLSEAAAYRLARSVAQPSRSRLRLPDMQLFYLFASSFIILFVGMGLFPVLPVYATEFGASRTIIGIYYASMYAANAAGAMLTNRLAAVLTHKGLFVLIGVLGIPALMLLGQASTLWQVIVLSAIVWFCGGVGLALVNVFTGQHASDKSRGKSFSLMFLAFPLGAVFGGTLVGKLVDTTGYHAMFLIMGAVWAVLPAIGLFKLKVASETKATRTTTARRTVSTDYGTTFYRVLAMTFMASIAINLGRLGTPLAMQAQGFTASEISSTATVSGLITIPVVLLIGALSDRLGRKTFLMLGYAAAAGGAVMLAIAAELSMFWVAATLVLVALCTNGALASALVADTLSADSMKRGLPWINAMNPVAGVLGFTSIGFVMDTFGQTPVFVIAVTVALLAAVLLSSLRRAQSSTAVKVEVCEIRDASGKCVPAAEMA